MTSYEEQHGDYHFIAVSDIGINHRLKGLPNQDSVLFHYSGENFMLAVSDGVGSCVHAALGSQYAVEAVKHVFTELIKKLIFCSEENDNLRQMLLSLCRQLQRNELCIELEKLYADYMDRKYHDVLT